MSKSMLARSAKREGRDTDVPAERDKARGVVIAASTPHNVEPEELMRRAAAVAAVATAHAASVDHESRFPHEAVDAMRAERMLSVAIPCELSGEGASVSDIVDVCYVLGRSCASSAMIYAMHQSAVACLVRHGKDSAWHQQLLRRLCREQLLFACSTTEGQSGGDVRNSTAPIVEVETGITLERQATVISYGEAADVIVTTARRSPDAAKTDQALAVFVKRDYALERLAGWDALGMRGTCSEGFKLMAHGSREQILPVGYEAIHVQTMVPVSHLAWSGAWAGIAASAVDRARAFVRKTTHRAGGTMPPGASNLTRAGASLRTLRSLVATSLQRFESVAADPEALASVDFQTAMNLLKVNASELAVATVMSAMQACGISGYRNDGEFSVSRHLRDILSSPIMISNDRILANVATASLLTGVPRSLRD